MGNSCSSCGCKKETPFSSQTEKKRHQQTNDLCDANSINTQIVSKQDVLFFQQNHLNQKDMDILSIGSE